MHNNAYPTYICTYIHIITHITHVVNTYKHNYMKIPHKFGHIRVNFLQSVRLWVTLGWFNGSFLARDHDSEWEGELPNTPNSPRSFTLWDGTYMWPSVWRLAPDVLSSRSLDLAAIDMKLVAVNWNSRLSHSNWVQGPWQEIKQTT